MPGELLRQTLLPRAMLLWIMAVLLCVCGMTPAGRAQAHWKRIVPEPKGHLTRVNIGQAETALNGPWKFHTGDDPAWAAAEFDDSEWGELDLTPPEGSYDRLLGTTGFVPGWTARGYPQTSGFAWYRLQLAVNNAGMGEQAEPLAVKMPDNCDDAYQVYVNGQLIGEMGGFGPHQVKTYLMRPRAFNLPAGAEKGTVTIAIRVWMDAGTALMAADAGGLHGPPVLGQASVIMGMRQLDWDAINSTNYSHMIEAAVLLLALIVVLALGRLDRDNPTYLWLGLSCAVTIAILGLILAGEYTHWISRTTVAVLQDDLLFPARIGLWIVFWGYWFRFPGMRWLHRWTWVLVFLLALGTALQRAPIYGAVVPVRAVVVLLPCTVIIKLMLGGLLVWVTYSGLRRDWADAVLALPAVVLVGVAQYHYEMFLLHIRVYYFPFGYRIALSQIGIILSLCIITVLLMRRFIGTLREREKWRLEIEQARQVQALLVPSKPPATPGFAVDAVYLPANTVGGDFFHVRPEEDGSLLVAVGDVSGKGLRAAMTVGAIMGALRNEDPKRPVQEILERLNRVLCGQISGFVTCCVARIQPDGSANVANAGHIPPYLAGQELMLANGLPLGLDARVHYAESRMRIRPGQQLTFVTDGVVEAMDRSGALFGFERTQALSTRHADQIAEAARDYGQNDDITVLTLTRQESEKEDSTAESVGAVAQAASDSGS